MKKFNNLILLVIMTHFAIGQTQIDIRKTELSNGLRVIMHRDNTMPIVAVGVLYKVGSKNELPGRSGFAHFFEHLMFEGSEHIARGEFMKLIQASGGVNNAYTTHDKTYYYEVLPSNQLEMALWMESERMLHAKIDTIGVETQREVVKEEKRLRIDNQPYMSFQENLFKRAYKIHPYKSVPIGTMEDLNAARLEEFMDFYKTFYVPENAVLVIAGDIEYDNAEALVRKYFEDIPRGGRTIPRPDVTEPPLEGQIVDTIYDDIQLPAVFVAYRMPSKNSDDALALSLVSRLLSTGNSSRLRKKLVDEQQIALEVVAFPYDLEDGGLFITLALANFGKDPLDILNSMNAEIEKVRSEKISDREFQKLLNQFENQQISQMGSMQGIADLLAEYEVFYGDANLINTMSQKIAAITPEDLMRVANAYLDPSKRIVLYYLPKTSQP
ncbi:M16 family metallopeptidase [Schleiferia thermophila]|jgi:predicted Zn-dependent peptidase|uniref:Putative Zn-dependent peptidase n=1 Tax=Schleiferia thermophila TaxID=884107 RepID=A0A369A1I8_9FLAO|nr:pitrilysin family protein [Schleiferia thermophila]KFD38808.1 peptidase M16 [Schleiferia thermophila str. Yellowstone]RCX01937.1 putative Zn-dependent peptidase [Schleiferia thermophila]GCD79757.1 peptidase M16 [Schleiferia thermophila]